MIFGGQVYKISEVMLCKRKYLVDFQFFFLLDLNTKSAQNSERMCFSQWKTVTAEKFIFPFHEFIKCTKLYLFWEHAKCKCEQIFLCTSYWKIEEKADLVRNSLKKNSNKLAQTLASDLTACCLFLGCYRSRLIYFII